MQRVCKLSITITVHRHSTGFVVRWRFLNGRPTSLTRRTNNTLLSLRQWPAQGRPLPCSPVSRTAWTNDRQVVTSARTRYPVWCTSAIHAIAFCLLSVCSSRWLALTGPRINGPWDYRTLGLSIVDTLPYSRKAYSCSKLLRSLPIGRTGGSRITHCTPSDSPSSPCVYMHASFIYPVTCIVYVFWISNAKRPMYTVNGKNEPFYFLHSF